MAFKGRVCSRGVWDESIPGISFDENGNSNYSKIFDNILKDFELGESGNKKWEHIVEEIKKAGKGKPYDCIIGVSGGTDSSYLLHLAKKYKLRPLAVYLDNGWSTNIAVSNIKKVLTPLQIDLVTHVIDYEEVKDVLKAYLRAQLPWADSPTDIAIRAILYKIANRYGLKHILIGHDFRSEGFQPTEWTYSDDKQLRVLSKKFSNRSLKTFPNLTLPSFIYYSFVKRIKYVKPFFYLKYSKQSAKAFLEKTYGWEDYGGHHYENIFTKFIISYWLYEKFGIDKRKISYSAQILSGEMTRGQAMMEIEKIPYNREQIDGDIAYICKKLDISIEEFHMLMQGKNKLFSDYPSYYPLYQSFKKIIFFVLRFLLPNKPLMAYQMESRGKK